MPTPERFARPARILIASDRNAALRDLETLLSEHGYSVFRVYAGSPALERARAVRPDVIVLDGELAARPSLELSRALRDDPELSLSTPILLLTMGPPTPQEHLAALRAGIWELLRRPLNPNELLLKLDSYVLTRFEGERASSTNLTDDLTSLYPAQELAHCARELIFQAAQHNTGAACVVLALEPGPGVARQASAELVRRIGQILKTSGRRADGIGRVGPAECLGRRCLAVCGNTMW